MMRREQKDVALFKNRKYIDYLRGFHDENYENYFIGLENGHRLVGYDIRLLSTESHTYCLKLIAMNATTEKLTLYSVDDPSFWPNCVAFSHRGEKLIAYKRSACLCVDPLTKLVVTCSCNDRWLPKVTTKMWTKFGQEQTDLKVPTHSDIRYVGFSESLATGVELKAQRNPWSSNPLFKHHNEGWDVCLWANETVTTPYFRQHCSLFTLIEGKARDYKILSYTRAGGNETMPRPFGMAFVASDKPRGTDIDGGFWTPTPFPAGSAHTDLKTCLLCPDP